MSDKQTTTWNSQSGFIWSLIGSAVGFANILSFSAQAYKNGGGAFMIPYFMALFVLGIPMLLLEGLIGYKWKQPLIGAFGNVGGRFAKSFGWLAVIACMTIGGFYIVLTGYSVAYTYFAATNQIPEDTKAFFVNTVLKSTGSIYDFGSLSIPIVISTFAVMALTWYVLVRNVKDGIEKICSVFMPMMAFIIAIFAITVLCLPGGINGLYYYLKPDFSKLSEFSLWRDVFGQLFFSLSLGLGIIVGYSRHTSQKMNVGKAMFYVAMGDFAVSFIAGIAIFGCLAHISFVQNIPFNSILTTDSTFEIGFVLFPKILKFFGPLLSQIFGMIFFFCVFIAGITGVFSIVESISGNIEVEFKISRRKAVTVTTAILMANGLVFCMGNASYIIDALVPMVIGTNMIVGGLALIAFFIYASKELCEDPIWMSKGRLGFSGICIRYIAPTLLAVILVGNLWQEFAGFEIAKGVRWGWFIAAIIGSATAVSFTERKRDAILVKVESH